jgi:hypothetical protein
MRHVFQWLLGWIWNKSKSRNEYEPNLGMGQQAKHVKELVLWQSLIISELDLNLMVQLKE